MYITVKDTKDGDRAITDGGFTCIGKGKKVTIGTDSDGFLFFPCRHGEHALIGQSDGRVYIGLLKSE